MSLSTGRWSELSAEYEMINRERQVFRYHDVQDMGVAEGLYELVVGDSVPKIRQEFSSA